MRKLHTRPALTWTAVLTFIRSHQQALGNRTNEWTPVGSERSVSVAKLLHSTAWVCSRMLGPVNLLVLWREHVVQEGITPTNHREPPHSSSIIVLAYFDIFHSMSILEWQKRKKWVNSSFSKLTDLRKIRCCLVTRFITAIRNAVLRASNSITFPSIFPK